MRADVVVPDDVESSQHRLLTPHLAHFEVQKEKKGLDSVTVPVTADKQARERAEPTEKSQ